MLSRSVNRIKLNEYALKLRLSGKTYREIGEVLGVSYERARQRINKAKRDRLNPVKKEQITIKRHNEATKMGDLIVSSKLTFGIKHGSYKNICFSDMTFNKFLKTTSLEDFLEIPNIGKSTGQELIEVLRKKKVSEDKIEVWINKKKKKKPRSDKGITTGPQIKYDTCQRYVVDKGRMVMGRLCNQPLTSKQRKYCENHNYRRRR